MTPWFSDYKQAWIKEMLHVYGHINRRHLMRKFGISEPQASKDLKTYRSANAGEVIYNKHNKRYERVGFREEEHR